MFPGAARADPATSRHPDATYRRVGSPERERRTCSSTHGLRAAGRSAAAPGAARPAARVRARGVRRPGLPRRRDGRHRRAGRASPSRCSTSTSPASSTSTSRCSTPPATTIIDNCRAALASTHDNKQRVAATMDVFYEYVAGDTGAFRLVFESDLTNEPAVREHVDRVTTECAAMIADVIHEDTGLPDAEARAARRVPGGNGPGQREVLAVRGVRHQAQSAGRRRRPGRRPGLARHPRLPPHRRALTDRTTEGEDPWRSRSACSTPPASSCVETNESAEDIEKLVADAVKQQRHPRARRHPGPPDPRARRQDRLRRDRRRRRRPGRLPELIRTG